MSKDRDTLALPGLSPAGTCGPVVRPGWKPYGISANWTALDTFLRYHYEQGLSKHRWSVDEIFDPSLLGT